MSSLLESDGTAHFRPRYSGVCEQKSAGATYTPDDLAAFVAAKIVSTASIPIMGTIHVLDPAIGDGALLQALIERLPAECHHRLQAVGYDTDRNALCFAERRLRKSFPMLDLRLDNKDFLQHVLDEHPESDLFSGQTAARKFDLVIANPPYVRTQVLGAQQAQRLAQGFGLSGRVDLYYPFLLGISRVLAAGGTAGIITSNRFMTTKSGQSVRRALLTNFKVLQAWDLGDTKLFDAAVLPAVIVAKRMYDSPSPTEIDIAYSSIYATDDAAATSARTSLAALSASDDTVVVVADGRRFRVRHGIVDNGGDPEGIWRLATGPTDDWLATVKAKSWATFRRIGKIRVGVKSTADKVFIRSDWDDLPGGAPELLRPLITRHCARRFKAMTPAKASNIKQILYPHEVTSGVRRAVDLSGYPKAEKYLHAHSEVLQARSYVRAAGRQWYELWVPQDPNAWQSPKLVFPDISERPIFWLDTDGGVVNGECYWLQCDNSSEQHLLWLALAVANSSFITRFYDHRFNNKLYAGRRRFITQYVEEFPLPNPDREESKNIIDLAKQIHARTPSPEAELLVQQLDALIWQVFGLAVEKATR